MSYINEESGEEKKNPPRPTATWNKKPHQKTQKQKHQLQHHCIESSDYWKQFMSLQ